MMPTMSRLDASQRQVLLELEENLRLNKYITKEQFECLDSYWKQLVIILMHKAANFWGTTLSANITYLLDECYRKKLGIKGAS